MQGDIHTVEDQRHRLDQGLDTGAIGENNSYDCLTSRDGGFLREFEAEHPLASAIEVGFFGGMVRGGQRAIGSHRFSIQIQAGGHRLACQGLAIDARASHGYVHGVSRRITSFGKDQFLVESGLLIHLHQKLALSRDEPAIGFFHTQGVFSPRLVQFQGEFSRKYSPQGPS